MNSCEFMWINMNSYESNQCNVNVSKFTQKLKWYQFKLFDLLRIYTNLYGYVLNLFENMHTAALLHTAAPLDSRTLLRALPDIRTPPRTLPYCRTRPCVLPHTAAAHCVNSNATHRTPHTAHCTQWHTAINMN
jgi:hypothetical protein